MSTPASLDRTEVRAGIVDDHALVSDALAHVLNEKGFEAFSLQPSTLDDVVEFAREQRLNVILLDLDLGALGSSIPVIAPLRDAGCRVIVVTGSNERPQWGECIEAGAAAVVSKAVSFTELIETVTDMLDDVAERRQTERLELLDSLRQHREDERQRLAPFAQLTVREHEVLLALTRGMSAEDISASMYVSIATVRSHIRSILQKLGVNSQLAAVALAVRAGWSPQT
jgi:DNA-binding NarL/FixJ family response regulator